MNIKFNVKTKIRFNGQEYAGVEAMPPEVRKVYEQAFATGQVHRSTKVVFNGHSYASLDEMPAEVRSQYEQVMGMLDKNHDGIPDMLETGQAAAGAPASDDSTLVEAAPLISQPAAPAKSKGRATVLILIGVLALIVVVTLFIFIKAGMH